MPKEAFLILRVDAETKARIEEAAQRQGMSVTSFVLRAVEAALKKERSMTTGLTKPTGRGQCPTFFMALCQEAKRGGEFGYAKAGNKLTRALGMLKPSDLDDEEWQACLWELSQLTDANDDGGVLAWFDARLPRCMRLVPARRRERFVEGVRSAAEEDPELFRL